MKKLLKMFKSLPPEMRMFLAMAGLASPIGIIYALKHFLFPGVKLIYLILGLFVIIAVLVLVAFILSRIFGSGRKKRQRRMASALSADASAGAASMSAAAAIRANNEKFFKAVKDMRKTAGTDVYELPWYVIIGDSGCGKTRLINESQLTFSLGKPEGYKLGTLNYNWWFTEDAIFIDMAGRLCNPQEDEDVREWQAFLDTVRKGRRGFPINGVVACVSADHLLEDSPEKVEQDANTMLERLRDLQGKLGVTFATYLVITKCDKIVGFLQFFERATTAVAVRNQMFGWSRPGEFNKLYDPEMFERDFGAIYGRLNELRLRTLHEEEEEEALGLAYSFPEEFRELREPLNTYVRTLFPMIKNPRAVKNLVFRGIYFTSSTQEGRLSLKRLTEALGAEAANQFAPLDDLYPRKKPFFIKDLLTRKVFPEHGIVFRNEQQVVRNRKFAKIVKVGGAALTVVMLVLLIWGSVAFGRLIGKPREVLTQVEEKPAKVVTMAGASSLEALRASAMLGRHMKQLHDHPWPSVILSLGMSSRQPIADLQTVRAGVFYEGVLRRGLLEAEQALRDAKLGAYGGGASEGDRRAEHFTQCLAVYLRLSTCKDADRLPPGVGADELAMLLKFARDRESPAMADLDWGQVTDELAEYLKEAREKPARLSPARLLSRREFKPDPTVRAAVAAYRDYLRSAATLGGGDGILAEWTRIRENCAATWKEYGELLELADAKPANTRELAEYTADLRDRLRRVEEGFAACRWHAGGGDTPRIERFADAVGAQRRLWTEPHDRWKEAYTSDRPLSAAGGQAVASLPDAEDLSLPGDVPDGIPVEGLPSVCAPDPAITALIEGLVARPPNDFDVPEGLDDTLKTALVEAGLLEPSQRAGEAMIGAIKEIYEYDPYRWIIEPVAVGGSMQDIQLTQDAQQARRELALIADRLGTQGDADRPQAQRLRPANSANRIFNARKEVYAALSAPSRTIEIGPEWRPETLARFAQLQDRLFAKGKLADAILAATASLAQVSDRDGWGLAELWDDYDQSIPSPFRIGQPQRQAKPPERKPVERESITQPPMETLDDFRRSRDRRTTPETPRRPPPRSSSLPVDARGRGILRCATEEFLSRAFDDAAMLAGVLGAVSPADYLAEPDADLPARCLASLNEAKVVYLARYFRDWRGAYDKAGSTFGERVDQLLREGDWATFKRRMRDQYIDLGDRYREVVSHILQHVVWPDAYWTGDAWLDDRALLDFARREAWKGVGFLNQIRTLSTLVDDEDPWEQVANRVHLGWRAFAEVVGKDPELPRDFLDRSVKEAKGIRWTVLPDELAVKLADLSFVQRIQEVVKSGRKLKAAEIQGWIVERQTYYGFSSDRLPYVDKPGGGIPGTVNPDQFQKFVAEITRASDHFAKLGDVDLAGYDRRRDYYRGCRAWYDLLTGARETAFTRPLTVEVETDARFRGAHEGYRWWDTLDLGWWGGPAPGDPGANFHREVQLWLGLRHKEDEACVSFPTYQSGRVWNCEWKWPSGDGMAEFKRTNGSEGMPPISVSFGEMGKLFLPALLESIGTSKDRQEWRVALVCDIPQLYRRQNQEAAAKRVERETPDKKDRVVGHKFVFKLGQKLPEPIACLTDLRQ